MRSRGWIQSVHTIEAYLKQGVSGELLLEKGHARAEPLAKLCATTKVTIRRVSREALRRTVKDQNARIAAFLPVDERGGNRGSSSEFRIEDFLNPSAGDILVAMDQVTDQHNIGAIIRSADRFGARCVLYPRHGAASPTADNPLLQSSAGTAAHLPHGNVVNLARTLRQFGKAGYWIYGADAKGQNVRTAVINRPAVLVLGSEDRGLRPNVRASCDALLSIPGGGFADSLNVSVAAGILLYEMTGR
ncbi:MAG: 23S rRNA (guanosine(2251)-2'-O)-methyltransferase RlmB [Spirochaetota bacterium]